VSGSAAEWNRIAKLMFNNYIENSNQGRSFWSDILEMQKLMRLDESNNVTGGKPPLGLRKTISIEKVYDIARIKTADEAIINITNPYDLNDKCHKLEFF